MSTVDHVDYVNKRIYLSASTVGVPLDTLDVYRDVRALRATIDSHRKFQTMIVAGGNIQKTTSNFTQPYVQLLHGCRIIPWDQTQSLVVVRDTFTDDGFSGVGCFDRAALTHLVDIDIQVSPVEVRQIPEIQYASFQNTVTVDAINGKPGITYPIGTTITPVISLDYAYLIALTRGLSKFSFLSDYVIDSADGTFNEITFVGTMDVFPILTIDASAHITNSSVSETKLQGFLDGLLLVTHSTIIGATYIEGKYENCEFRNSVKLGSKNLLIESSFSNPDYSFVIDCQTTNNSSVTLVKWSGNVTFINAQAGQVISINSTGGTITFDSTCSTANVEVTGIAKIIDNSFGVVNLTNNTVQNTGGGGSSGSGPTATEIANAVWSKPVSSMSVVGSIGAYISKRLLTLQQFLALGSSGGGSGGGSNDGVIIGLLNSILALVGSGGGGSGTSMYPYSWPTIATAGAQTLTMPTPFTGIFSLSINGLTQPIGSYSLVSNVLTLPSQLNLQVGDTVSADILT